MATAGFFRTLVVARQPRTPREPKAGRASTTGEMMAAPLTREHLLARVDSGWNQLNALLGGKSDGREDRRSPLTDEELLWEPVPGCWSVRRRDDGAVLVDETYRAPAPTPFATIAWRLAHIGISLRVYTAQLFHGLPSVRFDGLAVDVAGMMDFLRGSYDEWRAEIENAPLDGELAAKVASRQGHVDGHAAEVRVLRELYEA